MIASCGCITDGQKRELKEHGSVSFPVACYACDPQTVNVPWHWHDELEAVIVEKGSAVIEFGCGWKRMFYQCRSASFVKKDKRY